jgi:ABC-type bacteriocin/lantibiotic exporter with double-glycine peptidase domain
LPQLVTETDNGIKKVDYSSLTALLIQVNKEQEDKILSQEIKIQKIERNQIFLTNLIFMFCALIVLVILIFGVLFIINNKGTMQEERKM